MTSDRIFNLGFWTGVFVSIALFVIGASPPTNGNSLAVVAGAILFGLTLIAFAIERRP